MAFSSTFVSPESASLLVKPRAFKLIRPQPPAKLSMMRTLTIAAASEPSPTGRRDFREVMISQRVSPEMQAFLGVPEISRTRAIMQIRDYIVEQNLQDPENVRFIICDEKLKKIFGGRDRVGFFEIAGLVNSHFLK